MEAQTRSDSELIHACEKGQFDRVVQLLETGANINTRSCTGWTPLMLASSGGISKLVDLLLRKGALKNARGQDGWTPLMFASFYGHAETVDMLLKYKAEKEICTIPTNDTALLLAAEKGNHIVVELLTRNGANLRACNKKGETALILASERGHCIIVKHLIESGADVNTCRADGMTALMFASQNGHVAATRLLLANKANTELRTRRNQNTALLLASCYGHATVVKSLIDHGANLNAQRHDNKYTALMLAAEGGHFSVVKLLLESNADKDIRSKNGKTALEIAFSHCQSNVVGLLQEYVSVENSRPAENKWLYININNPDLGSDHMEAVKWPTQSGEDNHIECSVLDDIAKIDSAPQSDFTTLMTAFEKDLVGIVKQLIEGHGDVNARISKGWTLLMIAANKGHRDITKVLLEHEAEVDRSDDDGLTALMLACEGGHAEVVKLLLEYRADISKHDKKGWNCLMIACGKGHSSMVSLLNKHAVGAHINSWSSSVQICLMIACESGHCEVVRELIKWGADGRKPDAEGMTPLMLAQKRNHRNILEVLNSARRLSCEAHLPVSVTRACPKSTTTAEAGETDEFSTDNRHQTQLSIMTPETDHIATRTKAVPKKCPSEENLLPVFIDKEGNRILIPPPMSQTSGNVTCNIFNINHAENILGSGIMTVNNKPSKKGKPDESEESQDDDNYGGHGNSESDRGDSGDENNT